LNDRLKRFKGLLLVVLACVASGVQAQTPPSVKSLGDTPKSIMWVGNSFFYYNNGIYGHFGRLVRSAQSSVRGTLVAIGGSGLDWHDMESLVRPDGLGRYSFVGNNEVRFNKPGPQYDTAIMMDCSQCPVHPQLQKNCHEYVRRHSQTLRKAGLRPVLLMSWAYKDKPDMIDGLAEQYTLAGNQNEAFVIPAGLAFARSIAARPELELYQADKRHPSLAGTYLAACTAYAALYDKSPEGLQSAAGLAPDVASHLQAVAWETVKAYYKR
jgi:hypothetical protein